MITKEICFTDAFGKHICHKAGGRKFIGIGSSEPIEKQLLYAVFTASNDKSICHGTKILQGAKYDSYIIYSNSYLYFARKDTANSIAVIMDGSHGFQIPKGYNYEFYSEGNITIFWLVNTLTKTRVSHYKYILW